MKIASYLSLLFLMVKSAFALEPGNYQFYVKQDAELPQFDIKHKVFRMTLPYQGETQCSIYSPNFETDTLKVNLFFHGIADNKNSFSFYGKTMASNGVHSMHCDFPTISVEAYDRALQEKIALDSIDYESLSSFKKEKFKSDLIAELSEDTFTQRKLMVDAEFLLEMVKTRAELFRFEGSPEEIFVSGHSLGAFAALLLMGAHHQEFEHEFDKSSDLQAGIILSAPTLESHGFHETSFEGVSVPSLSVTGTNDFLGNQGPNQRFKAWQTFQKGQKSLLYIQRMGHFESGMGRNTRAEGKALKWDVATHAVVSLFLAEFSSEDISLSHLDFVKAGTAPVQGQANPHQLIWKE